MGFSSEQAPSGGVPQKTPVAEPSFGDRIGNFLQQRFPVAGGLADMVFGGSPGGQQVGMAAAQPQPQQAPLPDYSGMIEQNAKPKEGGGGNMILKLLGIM